MNAGPGLESYIRNSLELNLFWIRILKEHMILMLARFMPKDSPYIRQAENFKQQFESYLYETICLADGLISLEVLQSGELATKKTLFAEERTIEATGIRIETQLTVMEYDLRSQTSSAVPVYNPELATRISALNQQIVASACSVVDFMAALYQNVIHCNLFTTQLPSVYEHQRQETIYYIKQLQKLENHQDPELYFNKAEEERFWNPNMMAHAKVMRQLFDFSEEVMVKRANDLALYFEDLDKKARKGSSSNLTTESRQAAKAIRDFKARSTDLLLACELQGIMSPLLADHILREANYYLRLLRK
ncbi:MAG: DUF2935 domain-containing protein [Desulfitobacteriia bacterium]|jgi:hypothetical protein